MENEERKEAVGKTNGEAKVGEIVGPELKGMRGLEKAVYDAVSEGVVERAKIIVDHAAKGNAGCIKLMNDCCESYERRQVGVGIIVSLGGILVRALEDEESDSDSGSGSEE